MYQNIMKKFKFKMEEIKLFDSFAGIGALYQSLKELGVPVNLIGVSEIDVDAIISYAGGHIDNFKNIDFEYPSEKYMRDWLMKRNIGWDFKKNKSTIPRLKKDKLYKCYKACILMNNLGDVSLLDYGSTPDFDLFNMSFSCQDYSAAGKQKGKKDENGNITRSGQYIYGIEVIKHKRPKYIMIENVKGLIQKKFLDDFYSIVNEIEMLGYNCYYPKKDNGSPTCLNAKDYGIPQNRERIFVICVRKDIDTFDFKFPIGKDYNIRLKDILEDEVDGKYYLNDEVQEKFRLNHVVSLNLNPKILAMKGRYTNKGDTEQQFEIRKDNNTNTITTVQKDNLVIECSIENELIQVGEVDIDDNERQRRVYSIEGISPTILARTDNAKIIDNNAVRYRIRKLTPLECWLLMGFREDFFERAKELCISDSSLYKQAGNSIVVNCLYFIFKNLFKEYIINE